MLLTPGRTHHQLATCEIPTDVNMSHRHQLLCLPLLLVSERHPFPRDPRITQIDSPQQTLFLTAPSNPRT